MKKNLFWLGLVAVCFCLSVSSLQSVPSDLTGVWSGNDGGAYYLRQIGTDLWWYGEAAAENPVWANVAFGKIKGNLIELNWSDVPKGEVQSASILVLKIVSADHLIIVKQTGGFGTSEWSRGDNSETEE